jgi:hypothetical protein
MPLTFVLRRDAAPDLHLQGDLLARVSPMQAHWRGQEGRGYDVALYATTDDQYVVHWDYLTLHQGEACHASVGMYATREEALVALVTFDVTRWMASPDPAAHVQLQQHYADQVRTLTAHFDSEQHSREHGREV